MDQYSLPEESISGEIEVMTAQAPQPAGGPGYFADYISDFFGFPKR